MRLLSFIVTGLLLLILLLLILAFTPAGLHGGIWMAKRVLPGELTVTDAAGRLADQSTFGRLQLP
ncbi:MAG: hypothetical protein U5P41_05285 [Gammaproteobacteria bacterium]|nr:hypothetical protein [Gammaproteobacteria bacterium]